MESSIESILGRTYTDGIYHTHVSLIQPEGKYQFNRQTLEDFWKYYCDLIEKNKYRFGLAEKPQQYVPILVDVDLKVDVEESDLDKLYTLEQVEEIIKIYQKVLKEIVEDCNDANLVCVFLEKPPYQIVHTNKTYMKNGFHLHFPELFLDKADQEIHLIPRVKKMIQEKMLFSNIGVENSGNVIDKNCCSVPWLLYGSKKEEGATPYLFSKVYNANCQEISLEDAFKHYLIYDKHERVVNIK